jgi:hypothetical protein
MWVFYRHSLLLHCPNKLYTHGKVVIYFVCRIWSFVLLLQSTYTNSPITVAARSKAWTIFARSNAGIVCVYSVCVVLCVGSGLATGWSLVQGVLPYVKKNYGTEAEARAQQKAVAPLMSEWVNTQIHKTLLSTCGYFVQRDKRLWPFFYTLSPYFGYKWLRCFLVKLTN